MEQFSELIKTIYQIEYRIPDSKKEKKIILKMNEKQIELMKIIEKYF